MKQQQIVNAYKVIKKYENEKLPLDISYGLFKVKKLLQPQWDFEIEQENKIYEKYDPQFEDNGKMTFKNDDDELNFIKELNELLEMEIEWDEEKVQIDFNNRVDLSLADVEALDNFITF